MAHSLVAGTRHGQVTRPARAGTIAIAAHLPKEVRNPLKILAVQLDRTMNELIAEALDDLFAKHGKEAVPVTDNILLSDCAHTVHRLLAVSELLTVDYQLSDCAQKDNC